jgi:uncharacterized protein YdhG (YjbR/CyaY superfamily)
MKSPKDIDEYIGRFPADIQQLLEQVRKTVKIAAPHAEEVISYSMPAFKLNGILVWFAAYTKHIGFYPKTSAIERFKDEISNYKSAKGSVQFPLDKPLPLNLITKIIEFRINENLQKSISKKK